MDKRGMFLMFIGAILLAIFSFVNLPISVGLWVTLFVISLLIACIGTIMCIVTLAKSIKKDYEAKKQLK